MNKMNFKMLSALIALGITVAVFQPSSAVAGGSTENRVRLDCKGFGPGDSSMSARYELKGTREKLSISMEAAPGGVFQAGTTVAVTINGEPLGGMFIDQPGGTGDITGDLNFDTTAGPADADLPFPSGLVVGSGDAVEVGDMMGCALMDND